MISHPTAVVTVARGSKAHLDGINPWRTYQLVVRELTCPRLGVTLHTVAIYTRTPHRPSL